MIVLEENKLGSLEDSLREDIPRSLLMLSIVNLTTSKSKDFLPHQFVVDCWPDFKVIVAVPTSYDEKDILLSNCHYLYIKAGCESSAADFLVKSGVIAWTKSSYFRGIPDTLAKLIDETAKQHGGSTRMVEENVVMFALKPDDVIAFEPPEEFSLTTMPQDYRETILKAWKYASRVKNVDKLMGLNIENMSSSLLRDRNSQVLGHGLQYFYGSIGFLNVPEDQRGRGYSKYVLYDLAKKIIAKGNVPFSFIASNNTISKELHKKLGFQQVSEDTFCFLYLNY